MLKCSLRQCYMCMLIRYNVYHVHHADNRGHFFKLGANIHNELNLSKVKVLKQVFSILVAGISTLYYTIEIMELTLKLHQLIKSIWIKYKWQSVALVCSMLVIICQVRVMSDYFTESCIYLCSQGNINQTGVGLFW